jgi:hypothetical protein
MKKYFVIYELETEEGDIDKVAELAEHLLSEPEEVNTKVRLKEIKGEDEEWERFYDSEE